MNRRAIAATLFVLSLLGCARGRSAMPDEGPVQVPSAFTPIPRIQDTINAGLAPADPAARRATLEAPPSGRRRVKAPVPIPASTSPFSIPAPSSVRPRPIPVQPPPITDFPPPAAASTSAPAPKDANLPELPLPAAPPATNLKAAPKGDPGRNVPLSPLPLSDNQTPDPSRPASSSPLLDPTVSPVSKTDPTQAKAGPRRGMPLTQIAATVGDEEITLSELQAAVKDRIRDVPPEELKKNGALLNQVARSTLDGLIQRSMLIQAAKRKLKNDKNWDNLMKQFDRVWRERELPQWLQKYHVSNEYELKQLLQRRGQSLDAMRQEFKLKTAATEFLRAEIVPKSKVDLPEMRAYYDEHLHNFDRPAKITWREVAVELNKHKDRAEALRKAESVLALLRRGEPFEKVARSRGEGPNAPKGGLWETTPDNFGIPAVNQALNTIPLRQISPILEGPDGYHIVLVESRRGAGPATFAEVQDDIRDVLREQKFERGVEAYFEKIRTRTLITSMFDGTASAPSLSNADAPQPASNGR